MNNSLLVTHFFFLGDNRRLGGHSGLGESRHVFVELAATGLLNRHVVEQDLDVS